VMKEYTYSEARQRFATVLDKAYREGAVRIKRRDGKVFVVRPEQKTRSAMDVHGINLKIDRDEIIEFILAGRRKVKKSSV
jgi:PHD/YefM family antitoxin component YafN of YafNO toxin-antitoxin module